jgi:hypothetical protein
MADSVLANDTPIEFFRRGVVEAMRNQRVSASAFTEYYLVSLLASCMRCDRLPAREPGYVETPLAILYARALQASDLERARRLRALGDAALFITGFFPDAHLGRAVDHRYYRRLGGRAYAHLSREETLAVAPDVFAELAERFSEFADVLSEVAEATRGAGDDSLLGLYERWRRTGSARTALELARGGAVPQGHDDERWIH